MTSQFTELDTTIINQFTELDAIADEELTSASGGGFWSNIGQLIIDYGQFC